MFPFGHLGFAVLLSKLLGNSKVAYAMFFALLPDVIDKGLFLMGAANSSRGFAHTLAFLAIFSLSIFAFEKRGILRKNSAKQGLFFSCIVGTSSHLAGDLIFGFVPLLWPIQKFVASNGYFFELNLLMILELAIELIGLVIVGIYLFEKIKKEKLL